MMDTGKSSVTTQSLLTSPTIHIPEAILETTISEARVSIPPSLLYWSLDNSVMWLPLSNGQSKSTSEMSETPNSRALIL